MQSFHLIGKYFRCVALISILAVFVGSAPASSGVQQAADTKAASSAPAAPAVATEAPQPAPASDGKPAPASPAPPSPPAVAAPSSGAESPAAAPSAPAQTPIPGFDIKRMIPTYETIQEDWSSLQIGTSKLEPQPAMVGEVEDHGTYTRILARVQWRPGDPIDLWIFMPKGVKNPPVVLYLYGPAGANRFDNGAWAQRVTSGGVAAVGFYGALMGPRFHDRPMKQWFISELQESLGSTVHDIKFILDYLDKSGQVDMNRVGMLGEGVGGSIAILAAAADPRIKAIDTLDPWGDWPIFLTKSPVVEPDPRHAEFARPEFLKKVAPLDPVKWLPSLKIPVRIQQVKESDTNPLECKDAITAAAPKQAEVNRFATFAPLGRREGGGRLFDWVKDKLRQQAPVKPAVAKVAVVEKKPDEKATAKKQSE